MRKFLALVLALVMTMSLVTVSAGAATAFDDAADITNEEAVEVLNAMGVLTGNNGKFNPQGKLTRGAGAKIVAYLMLGQAKADKLTATYTVFEDVTDGVGLAPYIEWAAANGIIDGYGNGKFGPYDTLTQYAFGKMLLGALGYSAAEEGYTGAGWQKNVYGDATYAGIFDGTETYSACLRDDAARMALGALKANVVAYGTSMIGGNGAIYWNGELLGNNFAMVDGRIETTRALWSFYDGLNYKKLAADVWGRPGHKWTYTPNVVPEFEKFYMDAPVVEYTTTVTECELLVAAGVPETNTTATVKVFHFQDGVMAEDATTPGNTGHKHDNACRSAAQKFGAQGTLTQVFKIAADLVVDPNKTPETYFVVTEIDTTLTNVGRVIPTNHNNVGSTVLTPYENGDFDDDNYVAATITNSIADKNDGADYTTIDVAGDLGFALNTKILINQAAMLTTPVYTETANAMADAYAYEKVVNAFGTTVGYVAVVGEPTVLAGATYTGASADKSIAEVNGTLQKTAKHYDWSDCGLNLVFTNKYNFYVDQYGNLIGDAAVVNPYDFVVIQKAEWQQVVGVLNNGYGDFAAVDAAGELKAYNVFKYDGKIMTDVNGTGEPTAATLSQYWQDNAKYYDNTVEGYGIVKAYALADGRYNFEGVKTEAGKMKVEHDDAASIVKGNPNFAGEIADENTVFVVKYRKADLTVGYKSYTGIGAMDSVSNAAITTVYDVNGDKDLVYADFVFVDLIANEGYFTQANNIAFVTNKNITGYYEASNLYTYGVYVNGAPVTVTAKVNNLFDTTGVYELVYDAEGHVLHALRKFELTTTQDDFDGDNDANGKKFDAAGSLVADTSYAYDTVVGVGSSNFVVDNDAEALDTTNAKVFVVNYSDIDVAGNYDNKWGANDAFISVTAGTAANLYVGAQVIYVENAATTGIHDAAVIFVMNPLRVIV